MLARALFLKYVGGVESKANRAFDEELLALCGVTWDVDDGPPISRAHDYVESAVVRQEALDKAITDYDHETARQNFTLRHPPPRDRIGELEDRIAALEAKVR